MGAVCVNRAVTHSAWNVLKLNRSSSSSSILRRFDLSEALTHPLTARVAVCHSLFYTCDMRRVSSCPKKESSSTNGNKGQSAQVGSRWEQDKWAGEGIVALPQQVRGAYILIDRGRPLGSADLGEVGLILSKDWQGMGQGRAMQR